jgi:hypothetical protein
MSQFGLEYVWESNWARTLTDNVPYVTISAQFSTQSNWRQALHNVVTFCTWCPLITYTKCITLTLEDLTGPSIWNFRVKVIQFQINCHLCWRSRGQNYALLALRGSVARISTATLSWANIRDYCDFSWRHGAAFNDATGFTAVIYTALSLRPLTLIKWNIHTANNIFIVINLLKPSGNFTYHQV